jgi:hypothetical protein
MYISHTCGMCIRRLSIKIPYLTWDFLDRGLLLTRKLLNQGFLLVKLKSSLTSKVLLSPLWLGWPLWNMCNKWPRICSTFRKHFPVLSLFMTCHRICNYINTTGVTNGTGTAYPSGAPEFIPGFSGVRVTQSLVLCTCIFCRSLFVLLSFFFLAIVLSVLLRFTDSDYPFGIFKLFLYSWITFWFLYHTLGICMVAYYLLLTW